MFLTKIIKTHQEGLLAKEMNTCCHPARRAILLRCAFARKIRTSGFQESSRVSTIAPLRPSNHPDMLPEMRSNLGNTHRSLPSPPQMTLRTEFAFVSIFQAPFNPSTALLQIKSVDNNSAAAVCAHCKYACETTIPQHCTYIQCTQDVRRASNGRRSFTIAQKAGRPL